MNLAKTWSLLNPVFVIYLAKNDFLRNSLTSLPIKVLFPRNLPNTGTASPSLSVENSAHVTPNPLAKASANESPLSITSDVYSYFSGLSPSNILTKSSPAGPITTFISGVINLIVSFIYL